MNEVELSNDLNIITAEIKTWKNFAGMSVWEIGKRIKHVKINDLAHGQYIKWLDSIGMDRSEASRYIKIADELPNDDTWQHLSTRAMYLIATLPTEQKEKQIQRVENGEKPTVKEIEDIKRKNREQEKQIKEQSDQLKAKNDQIEMQARMIDVLNEQGPEVVEVEKVPDDYDTIKDEFESAKRSLKIHRKHIEQLEMEREQLEKQLKNESDSKKRDEKQDELQEMELKRLQREADINVYRFILATTNFIKDQSISAYDSGAIASASEATKEKLIGSVQMLEKFIKEVKTEIKGEVTWVIN